MNHVLFTKAITSLRVGAGQGLGVIDLPIARERATNWPVIPGSSVKGVLRDASRLEKSSEGRTKEDLADLDTKIAHIFGSTTDKDARAGCLEVSDQRIVLFPVRSISGTFAYLTCSLALARLRELYEAAKIEWMGPELRALNLTKLGNRCYVTKESKLKIGATVAFEDIDLDADTSQDEALAKLGAFLGKALDIETYRILERLAVVSDSDFTYFAETATEMSTKVTLNFETKTARGGMLRNEESVPPEAVFAGLALAKLIDPKEQAQTAEFVFSLQGRTLQFGSKASTGQGICKLTVVSK